MLKTGKAASARYKLKPRCVCMAIRFDTHSSLEMVWVAVLSFALLSVCSTDIYLSVACLLGRCQYLEVFAALH